MLTSFSSQYSSPSMHQDIDCFMLVTFPIRQMTTSIDSLYKYTTTTSISILTLIQSYSYIPLPSPHHLVQQTHDSSSLNEQLSEQHVFYCNYKSKECCSEPNQTIILPREVKLTLGLLPFTPDEVDPVLTECSCSEVAATSMSDASSICVAVQENHKCLMDPLTQIHTQHR